MIRSDGIDVGQINGITLDKNVFGNFHPIAGDHPDAMQFWQINSPLGSSNITITNNVVMQGAGVGTQGIWISDPNAVGYSNVRIQNNLLYGNDQYHGISVDGGHGVQILGNTILSNGADSKTYWIQLVGGDNFTVRDNVADKILVQPGAKGVTLSHNVDLTATPWLKSLIPNLNAPTAPKDLVIADYGYHVPGTLTTSNAPVSTVLGQSIEGSINTVSSAQTTQIAISDTSAQTVAPAATPTFTQVFSSPPTNDNLASSAPVLGGHGFVHHHLFDHFTAMA
jgi:hypothetical protein